jgi:hypothetical protein
MTERRMMVTIGYDHYVGHPSDIAELINIGDRLIRVEFRNGKYDKMHSQAEQRSPVSTVQFIQWDGEPVEEQPSAATPRAPDEIEPVPARARDFSKWEDWLAECRRIEGKTQYPETEKRLRTFFDAGQTPETAIDETAIEIPF